MIICDSANTQRSNVVGSSGPAESAASTRGVNTMGGRLRTTVPLLHSLLSTEGNEGKLNSVRLKIQMYCYFRNEEKKEHRIPRVCFSAENMNHLIRDKA